MDQCKLIFIRAGETAGLQWELREIVKRVEPDKVLVYFPRKLKFAKFRQWANAVLPKPLPEQWPSDTIVFSAEWEPSLPLAGWWEMHEITIQRK